MLCILESWSNSVISTAGSDREENRYIGTPPTARRMARTEARLLSKENPNRNYCVSTWNSDLKQFVNFEVFQNGYQLDD